MTDTVHTMHLRFYPPRYFTVCMSVSAAIIPILPLRLYCAIGVNIADFGIYANVGVSSGINVMIFHSCTSNSLQPIHEKKRAN